LRAVGEGRCAREERVERREERGWEKERKQEDGIGRKEKKRREESDVSRRATVPQTLRDF
jgi:hypothetical protein